MLELSGHMTIRDVGHHLGSGWDVVKEIQKRYLHKKFSRPKLNNLRQLAIDEISIGKGFIKEVPDHKTDYVLATDKICVDIGLVTAMVTICLEVTSWTVWCIKTIA